MITRFSLVDTDVNGMGFEVEVMATISHYTIAFFEPHHTTVSHVRRIRDAQT